MGLFSFLKKRQKDTSTFMMEDDYCQVEIIPASNYSFLTSEAVKISDFGKEHFNGVGFDALYARKSNPHPTSELFIIAEELENTLAQHHFNRIKEIQYIGGDLIDYQKGGTRAYGETSFSFWTEVKNNKVTNIWVTSFGKSSNERISQIAAALYAIGKKYGLILADWNSCEIIDLTKHEEIDAYLECFRSEEKT